MQRSIDALILGAIFLVLVFFALALCGCGLAPQKGGKSTLSAHGSTITVDAPENPNTPTSQATEVESVSVSRIPLSSLAVAQLSLSMPSNLSSAQRIVALEQLRAELDALERSGALAPLVVTNRTRTSHAVTLGSSWQDTARIVGAKMKAALPLLLAGIAFLVGGGALAYFGWWTKAVIAWDSGIACISLFFMLPSLTPMHWLMVISGLLLVGGVMLAIYYAYNKGQLDKDGDGIPDALQGK